MTDRKIIQIAFGSNGWTLHALADDGTLWRALHNWDWELCPNIPQSRTTPTPTGSLKEQALALVNSNKPYLDDTAMDTIRRALEQLND
jgi:hypothetical protein